MPKEQSFHTAYCCGYRTSYNSHTKGQDIYFACFLQALVSCYLCDTKPLEQFCFTDHKTTLKLVRCNSAAS